MGIGGGIITKKVLFAVLLIASLSLSGVANASAADVGTAQTQTNSSSVQEKVNKQLDDTNSVNKTTETQKEVTNDVKSVKKTETATTSDVTQKQSTTEKTVNTTNDQNSETSATNTEKTEVKTQDTTVPNQSSVDTTKSDESNTSNFEAAAGEVKTATTSQSTVSPTFTVTDIKDAASRVKAYVETNKRLPNYVTIGTVQVEMPDFLKLLTAGLLQINSGTNTPITLKSVNNATTPTENIKSGSITKSSYLDLAKRVNAYIDANGKLPNYASSSLGKLRYESLIYLFSKVLNFDKTSNRLPSYVTVKAWSTIATSSAGSVSTPVPSDLAKYLAATTNCQVNNAQIKALAASITAGKTSSYDKAVAIFNWVRDNLGYSFYYNTKYGAVGTLNARTGNCVDTSHLLIALERAAGIPARYEHVYAKFTSGNWYGHVIAQVWVNGKWYKADATSSRNSFGVVNNWNTATATVKGIYTSLPF